ncbi:MAG: ADP-ribosylglycohydrolase family protein [Planctomycetes bacterium]|nr:ADP-ribosylglycohydrolase family protein [Planctomycetota bacterium]
MKTRGSGQLHRAVVLAAVGAWIVGTAGLVPTPVAGQEFRRLPVKEYRDKMKAGWIGQIIGVSWGAPTEGRYQQIMPLDKVPSFTEDLVNNAFDQDDLYVEMTFLRTMEEYGYDVPIRQAGIDFANSGYALWVANAAGRNNLRNGIAPPDSSHPKFHNCAGAIDYQIEADYSGLIAPGMPDVVIALGEKFGRLMNYGDGVYAGQFIGTLYAEAFFEKDVMKLIEAGLRAIPSESRYAEMVRDMIRWHQENPTAWEKTWALAEKKYNQNKDYNISALDVKREGAWVLMGLLYGQSDLDQTMIISCRCGFDSDCNPSSSGGILFTTRGVSNLPEKYYRKLDETKIFSHTAYNFPKLLDVCEKLARQGLARVGGRVEKNANGQEVFVIPAQAPTPSRFEDLKSPGPSAASVYTDAEMAQIRSPGLRWASSFLDGWKLSNCNLDQSGMLWEEQGHKNVFVLNGLTRGEKGYVLAKTLTLRPGRPTALEFVAGCDPKTSGWKIAVKADGKDLATETVNKASMTDGWTLIRAPLPADADQPVAVEITTEPVTPPPERRGPPALSLTLPKVVNR